MANALATCVNNANRKGTSLSDEVEAHNRRVAKTKYGKKFLNMIFMVDESPLTSIYGYSLERKE